MSPVLKRKPDSTAVAVWLTQDIDYVGLTQSGRLVIKLPKLFVEEVREERALAAGC